MSKFTKFIPALAVVVALSPLAANASLRHDAAQNAAYSTSTSISSQLAANSKGRPAEFAPAANEVAANSKGRPAEFAPAASNEVAANSKGRPGEYAVQVADNSKGRPGEFSGAQYETPIG